MTTPNAPQRASRAVLFCCRCETRSPALLVCCLPRPRTLTPRSTVSHPRVFWSACHVAIKSDPCLLSPSHAPSPHGNPFPTRATFFTRPCAWPKTGRYHLRPSSFVVYRAHAPSPHDQPFPTRASSCVVGISKSVKSSVLPCTLHNAFTREHQSRAHLNSSLRPSVLLYTIATHASPTPHDAQLLTSRTSSLAPAVLFPCTLTFTPHHHHHHHRTSPPHQPPTTLVHTHRSKS
jgi:hypothetical protein